jgi:hypothetical protein
VIEQLIEAERLLSVGLVDQAERLYRGVADRDSSSSIAVVGLARVALERGDDRTAYVEARRALAIDPDNPAAQHLAMRLTEVMEGRGEALPVLSETAPASGRGTEPDGGGRVPGSARPDATTSLPEAEPTAPPAKPARRGFVDRLLGRGQ